MRQMCRALCSSQRRKRETSMKLATVSRILLQVCLAVFAFAIAGVSGGRLARPSAQQLQGDGHCKLVGGTITTNFGGVDQNTTLGTATGDLRGGVTGTILGAPQPGPSNTLVFHIQHHWVTESGDTLFFDPAIATTVPLSQTLFGILSYPIHLTGGTGRFVGATGNLNAIGEVDLTSGTVFRYSGQVCFAGQD